MPLELKSLSIDRRPHEALAMQELLGSLVTFSEFEVARSPREALELVGEREFDICFVSEDFSGEDLNALLRDLASLQNKTPTLLVQVRDDIGSGETREELAGSRFATVITRHCSEEDRKAFKGALDEIILRREVTERSEANQKMTELVLREVDRVSRDLKRGRTRKLLRGVFGSVMRDCVDFDPQVMTNHIDFLEKRAASSEPAASPTLNIPTKVQRLKLPGMGKASYSGESARVWDMLVRKYGEKARVPDTVAAAPKTDLPDDDSDDESTPAASE